MISYSEKHTRMLSQSLVLNEINKISLDRSIPNNFVVQISKGKEKMLEGHNKIRTSTEKKKSDS